MNKKWTKLALIALSAMALCACKSNPVKEGDDYHNSGMSHHREANESAQAQGMGATSHFNGQMSSNDSAAASKRIYYFDFDKDVVHDEYKPSIQAHANYLVAHRDTKILIEGHTDPRGSREYNIGLGERRAKSVVNELTSSGVNPSQIRVVSYGAEKLAAPGHTEIEFQKDRRAVLVYAQN